MRLDHIAYRVNNRKETAKFFTNMFGYNLSEEFDIDFNDGSSARCCAMSPPEKGNNRCPWVLKGGRSTRPPSPNTIFHLPPEIFISDGDSGSIVGKWVKERGGVGGIHHMAYQVDDISGLVSSWKDSGIKFLSEEIINCPEDDIRQIFTEPLQVSGGVIIELIERGAKGFCTKSVKTLMESTDKGRVEKDSEASYPDTLNWLLGRNDD